MSDNLFLEILKKWEREVADPVIYRNLDTLLPGFQFKLVQRGGLKEHWASRFKADLTPARRKNIEKTVVYPGDMHIREQGDFANGEWVLTRLEKDWGLSSPYDVYKEINSRFSLDMPTASSTEVASAIRKRARKAEVLDALNEYFIWCYNNTKSPKATKVRSYIKKKRGFSDESIAKLGFGFVPSWDQVEKHMTQDLDFTKEELDAVCTVRNDKGRTSVGLHHNMSIPYNCGGVLKGFIFRRVDSNDNPKYIANTGLDRKSALFNIPVETEDVLIVEGELDALSATAAGIPSVAAIGGSDISGDRRKQIEDAFRRGVKRILLCLDLDAKTLEDGTEVPNYEKRHQSVMRTVHTIKDIDFDFDKIYVVSLPYPSDPDSFIRENGVEAFKDLLRSAVPYWKFDFLYRESK